MRGFINLYWFLEVLLSPWCSTLYLPLQCCWIFLWQRWWVPLLILLNFCNLPTLSQPERNNDWFKCIQILQSSLFASEYCFDGTGPNNMSEDLLGKNSLLNLRPFEVGVPTVGSTVSPWLRLCVDLSKISLLEARVWPCSKLRKVHERL